MDQNPQRWIRAHEVGEYGFCARAWWLRRQGHRPAGAAAREAGWRFHRAYGRRRRWADRLLRMALGLALAALAALGAWLLVGGGG